MIRLVLFVLFLSSFSYAGGTIPQGYGIYDKHVPAHHKWIRWYWDGNGATERAIGELGFATASLDLETEDWRLLFGKDASPAPVTMTWFRFNDDPESPGCTDDIPDNCVLGLTQCIASYSEAGYKFCTKFKVTIYVNNLKVRATAEGYPWEDRLYALLRHEWGHALGLVHDGEGIMADGNLPVSQCQHGRWSLFHLDPAITTWSYPVAPQCVQPQAQRAARTVTRCPSVE